MVVFRRGREREVLECCLKSYLPTTLHVGLRFIYFVGEKKRYYDKSYKKPSGVVF